jgi:hypothetical protein
LKWVTLRWRSCEKVPLTRDRVPGLLDGSATLRSETSTATR